MMDLRKYTKKIRELNKLDLIMRRYGVRPNDEKKCICPFHNDTGYSLEILDDDRFRCTVCHKAGDIVTFVRLIKNVNFWQALKVLTPSNMEFPFERELKLSLEKFDFNLVDPELNDFPTTEGDNKKVSSAVTIKKNMMSVDEIINRVSIRELVDILGFQPSRTNYFVSYGASTDRIKIYRDFNYFCFYDGLNGDPIFFLADYKKITYNEAKEVLREMIRREVVPLTDYRKKYLIETLNLKLNDFTKDLNYPEFYNYHIKEGLSEKLAQDEAIFRILIGRRYRQELAFRSLARGCKGLDEEGYKYLREKRLLTRKTIGEFGLFSFKRNSEVIELFNEPYIGLQEEAIGLSEGDRFLFEKHRIIIPYYDNDGIHYLRGRYFYDGSDVPVNVSKYVCPGNSSYTLTPKRFFNFGIIDEVGTDEPLLICENEFNTMLAVQSGHKAIGISSASNFPRNQLRYIRDLNIYLLMNNNEYSKKGAIEIAKMFERPVKIIDIKKYADLTELVSNVGEVDLLNDSKYVKVREFQGT